MGFVVIIVPLSGILSLIFATGGFIHDIKTWGKKGGEPS
jgi:hypothetical protein